MLVFAVVPGLVVNALYGPGFRDATPYVLAVGVIGLTLSLNNMLVQFFMAVHDYWFVPILAFGCITEAGSVVLFHVAIGHVVADVLVSLIGLLLLLVVRCYVLLPKLGAERVSPPDQSVLP